MGDARCKHVSFAAPRKAVEDSGKSSQTKVAIVRHRSAIVQVRKTKYHCSGDKGSNPASGRRLRKMLHHAAKQDFLRECVQEKNSSNECGKRGKVWPPWRRLNEADDQRGGQSENGKPGEIEKAVTKAQFPQIKRRRNIDDVGTLAECKNRGQHPGHNGSCRRNADPLEQ